MWLSPHPFIRVLKEWMLGPHQCVFSAQHLHRAMTLLLQLCDYCAWGLGEGEEGQVHYGPSALISFITNWASAPWGTVVCCACFATLESVPLMLGLMRNVGPPSYPLSVRLCPAAHLAALELQGPVWKYFVTSPSSSQLRKATRCSRCIYSHLRHLVNMPWSWP